MLSLKTTGRSGQLSQRGPSAARVLGAQSRLRLPMIAAAWEAGGSARSSATTCTPRIWRYVMWPGRLAGKGPLRSHGRARPGWPAACCAPGPIPAIASQVRRRDRRRALRRRLDRVVAGSAWRPAVVRGRQGSAFSGASGSPACDNTLVLVRSATLERPKSEIFGFRPRREGAEFPLAAGDDLTKHSAVRGVPLGPGEAELAGRQVVRSAGSRPHRRLGSVGWRGQDFVTCDNAVATGGRSSMPHRILQSASE